MSYGEIMREIGELGSEDATNVRLRQLRRTQRLERRIVLGAVSVLFTLALFDASEDILEGQGAVALTVDLLYVLAGLGILVYLYRLSPLSLKERDTILTSAIVEKYNDSEAWRNRASGLLAGLGEVIEEQFTTWGLSEAEKDVALLLLKGFSLKEISAIRETSDRTVRQQASMIYTKAGVAGRAELSAFFLEDLLLPGK